MKSKRFVSLLLCAVMLLILSISAAAYPLPSPDYLGGIHNPNTFTRFDSKNLHDPADPDNPNKPDEFGVFDITFKDDGAGYKVEGIGVFNALFTGPDSLFKGAQPGDQFAFTLRVKNEMTMPLKSGGRQGVSIQPTIRCVIPEVPKDKDGKPLG